MKVGWGPSNEASEDGGLGLFNQGLAMQAWGLELKLQSSHLKSKQKPKPVDIAWTFNPSTRKMGTGGCLA